MKVLVPIISGKESDSFFINSVSKVASEVILLQIVDKQFLPQTGAAIGEVRQLRLVLDEIKKSFSLKKKKLVEVTEWGVTIPKIISIALLQKVDLVFLVKQDTHFFKEIVSELKKKRIKFELIELPVEVIEKKKLF